MHKLKIIITFFFLPFLAMGQEKNTKLVEVDNDELKYLLSYLKDDGILKYEDAKKHFFIKSYQITAPERVVINEEESVHNVDQFYFLVSNFGERVDVDAEIFKTKSLINPKITRIEESADKSYFEIHISFFKPEKSIEREGVIYIEEKDFKRNEEVVFKVTKF